MKSIKLTGFFLGIILLMFVASCGGGGSGHSSSDNDHGNFDEDEFNEDENLDENVDPNDNGNFNDDTPNDDDVTTDGTGSSNGTFENFDDAAQTEVVIVAEPVVQPEQPVSEVSFNLDGAIGLAIDDTPLPTTPRVLRRAVTNSGSSNLKRVNADNSLSSAVSSGSLKVQSFMVAAGNQIYLLLDPNQSDTGSCILIRVDGDTNESTCVDSNITSVGWSNNFGDPIQFDNEGNIYYQGRTSDGRTVLRENASGEITDLINDNITLSGFLVLYDGTIFVAGSTNSTGSPWTRIITPPSPQRSLRSFLNYQANFLTLFPDSNIYFGSLPISSNNISRYLTATNELDPRRWIGNTGEDYHRCADAGNNSSNCARASIIKTTNGQVFAITGNMLAQYYPEVAPANTVVTDITLFRGILSYIILGGFDNEGNNALTLYDTETDTETDLLGSEDIEVYHVGYLNSDDHQIVMFDGLRFSDNRYVLCQVDLTDDNALTCSVTGTNELTDLQLFENTDTIAGGNTNSTKTYTIGGTITGLEGTLVLQNNGVDTITRTQSGSFTFPITVVAGEEYDVAIQVNSLGQTCSVSNGHGTVDDSHVTSVSIDCFTHRIGGTISGLSGTVVLQNNGGNPLTRTQNGSFLFPLSVSPNYNVTVQSHPLGQTCTVTNGSGTVTNGDVTVILVACSTNSGVIVTVAGGGNSSPGNGNAATSASLSSVRGVAFDSEGNLYFSEASRIRKVDSEGIITTVAGTGVYGSSGDDGLATNAQVYSPHGMAVDASGNIYIADSSNHRIRKIDTAGIITTVAGTGVYGFSGDGGLATNAQLYLPYGIAVSASGNLYIADTNNFRIRKVDTNGVITTVAGTGMAGSSGDGGTATIARLTSPWGVAVSASGNIYIADTGNHRIRKVDTNGIITTVVGTGVHGFSGDGGLATNALLFAPRGITVDALENIYISDTSNHRIRKVDTAGVITTIAGIGNQAFSGDGLSAIEAGLYAPQGIAFDSSGNLFIADGGNNRIRMVAR